MELMISCVNVQWFIWSQHSSHQRISGIICGVFKSFIAKLKLLKQGRIPWIGPWSCPWSSSSSVEFHQYMRSWVSLGSIRASNQPSSVIICSYLIRAYLSILSMGLLVQHLVHQCYQHFWVNTTVQTLLHCMIATVAVHAVANSCCLCN